MAKNRIEQAYEIIRRYEGSNPLIKAVKHNYDVNKAPLKEFDIEYILANYDYQEFCPNKTVGITPELGTVLQTKYLLTLVPQKIRISRVVGEMGQSYHCYVKYRQSEPERLMFVQKRGILGNLKETDWKSADIDFSPYDDRTSKLDPPRFLKEHQKEGVRFLVTNRKCICADSMGVGKTSEGIVAALASGSEKILIITTAALKTTWRKECELYVDKDDINVINGSMIGETKRVNILNYDIIKNFYTVAEEPEFTTENVYNSDGVLVEVLTYPVMVKGKDGKMVQKMKKSRSKKAMGIPDPHGAKSFRAGLRPLRSWPDL